MNARRTRVAPRPTSRRSSRRRHDIRMGVPLIALAIVLIGGLIGASVFLARSRVELNADTGCPVKGPSAVTAILFDRTDPINDKQKLYLQNKLDSFRGTTQKYEEVDTYALEDQGDGVVKPILRICDPGRGTDVSSLTATPGYYTSAGRGSSTRPSVTCSKTCNKEAAQKHPLSLRQSSRSHCSRFNHRN